MNRRNFLHRRHHAVERCGGHQGGRGHVAGSPDDELAGNAGTTVPGERPSVQPGRDAERLDAALAHEQRRQGVSPGRRTGRSRDGAGNEGEPVGLQRPEPGSDDRSGRGRPRAHLRHQQAARTHDDPLARAAAAERHGRRHRTHPTAHRSRQDLRLRVRRASPRHLHVSPARRRDGADGDGHDGFLGHASEGP